MAFKPLINLNTSQYNKPQTQAQKNALLYGPSALKPITPAAPLPMSIAQPTYNNLANPYGSASSPTTPRVASATMSAPPVAPKPMVFDANQTAGLTAAAARRTAGTATADDIKHLTYAEQRGFKASAAPVAPSMITGYRPDGSPVQVPKGQYVPGVSLTPPSSKTSDGADINPATGGISAPKLSPEEQAVSDAEKAYKAAIPMTPEEMAAQKELDTLNESTRTAYQNTSDQAIPLEFITGQKKSIESRALNLAEPLNAKLARLQARRTSAIEASKFALDRADAAATAAKPIAVASGASLIDPKTGKQLYSSPTATKRDTSIAEVNGRKVLIDMQTGEPIVDLGGAGSSIDYSKILSVEEAGKLGVPYGTTVGEASGMGVTPGGAEAKTKASMIIGQTQSTINKITEATGLVTKTSGFGAIGRVAASKIPGTDSYNLKAAIDTIQANLAFDRLQQMRDSSPTGGALGAVSEREINLLQSAVQSLDLGQSNSVLIANLNKVKEHYENWKKTVEEAAKTAQSQTTQSQGNSASGGFTW